MIIFYHLSKTKCARTFPCDQMNRYCSVYFSVDNRQISIEFDMGVPSMVTNLFVGSYSLLPGTIINFDA